jgi:hypothetical protein
MNQLTKSEIDFLANVVQDYIETNIASLPDDKGRLLHIFSKIVNNNREAVA